jgi:SAM-dependent methyltransferase
MPARQHDDINDQGHQRTQESRAVEAPAAGDRIRHGLRIGCAPMEGPTACRICSGALRLIRRGGDEPLAPNSLAPTCHRTGAHGDLYRCESCGAVEQPSLPRGDELHELYRRMRDEEYLREEVGRRRTAARLLKLLGPPPSGARLLEVGCGPGLLLDEARRLGWSVHGLDLSMAAARYARERLGLRLIEQPLEEADLGSELFDAIVIADVLEHLDDPVGAIDRCAGLLAPGGALLIVTPDPSSPTARLFGRRWWGYIPAHSCLVPRATLRRLIEDRGMAIAADRAYVRSFSPAYWLDGLAERGVMVKALRGLARRLPSHALLSLSLGDERVLLARRASVRSAPEPPGAPPADRSSAARAADPAGP